MEPSAARVLVQVGRRVTGDLQAALKDGGLRWNWRRKGWYGTVTLQALAKLQEVFPGSVEIKDDNPLPPIEPVESESCAAATESPIADHREAEAGAVQSEEVETPPPSGDLGLTLEPTDPQQVCQRGQHAPADGLLERQMALAPESPVAEPLEAVGAASRIMQEKIPITVRVPYATLEEKKFLHGRGLTNTGSKYEGYVTRQVDQEINAFIERRRKKAIADALEIGIVKVAKRPRGSAEDHSKAISTEVEGPPAPIRNGASELVDNQPRLAKNRVRQVWH